ncbi:MAG: hypothetical protein M3N49_01680 [Candidatus Eremiobacteraeota bacterium]|nr:hypothetical protein [Candidatus Eremiobacteraeota bacterium]
MQKSDLSELRLIAFLAGPGMQELNRQKNRVTQPANPPEISVTDLNGFQGSTVDFLGLGGRNPRREFASIPLDVAHRRAAVLSLISGGAPRKSSPTLLTDSGSARITAASVIGYLAVDDVVSGARKSGKETPNCGGSAGFDFHIWLVQSKGQPRSTAAIVEMTPRWQATNSTWKVAMLEKLANDGTQVRVTGWILFDPEHPDEVGKTRGGQWEIHPVTKFEYDAGGGKWIEL